MCLYGLYMDNLILACLRGFLHLKTSVLLFWTLKAGTEEALVSIKGKERQVKHLGDLYFLCVCVHCMRFTTVKCRV